MSNLSPAAILYDSAGVEKGTGANPVRTDPTGTTAQPVSDGGGSLTVDGPLTDAQLRASAVPVSAATLPLPAGAATEATLALVKAKTDNLDVALSTRWSTLGQKAMAASAPIVVASDQSPVRVRGADADGVPATEAPVLAAGNDGTNVRTLRTDVTGRQFVRQFEEPTFVVQVTGAAIGNGKSMLSLLNTGTAVMRLRELWIINSQTTSVTGIVGEFQARRITGHSAGTNLTGNILPHDTADAVPAGLSARTGATVAGQAAVALWRRLFSTDEFGPGAQDVESNDHAHGNHTPVYKSEPPKKPITIRQNEGVHILFNTNSTAGSFDVVAVLSEGVL